MAMPKLPLFRHGCETRLSCDLRGPKDDPPAIVG
jgi:hypothetical protein